MMHKLMPGGAIVEKRTDCAALLKCTLLAAFRAAR
jgi:hypothetical protein